MRLGAAGAFVPALFSFFWLSFFALLSADILCRAALCGEGGDLSAPIADGFNVSKLESRAAKNCAHTY